MTERELPIVFDGSGLISAVITDATSGDVLMVGFMNSEALERTRSSGLVHFWSRSRQTLWKKGETSGHVQRVREIRVNCDRSSLLLEVDQAEAVCHDGYSTCYYRRLEVDNSLTIVRDRQFDPEDVYPSSESTGGLASVTRRWWSGFEWLRDHNVSAESGTSRRLRATEDSNTRRIADELRELAGVLDGTHHHRSLHDDVKLESGQVLYWIACSGVYHEISWEDARPDRALDIGSGDTPTNSMLATLLNAYANRIETHNGSITGAFLHELLALIGNSMRANKVDPLIVIVDDVSDLVGKPYFTRNLDGSDLTGTSIAH